jgi:hypothetical protein
VSSALGRYLFLPRSEVAAAGEPFGGTRSSELIERNPLGPRADQLDNGSVRYLKARRNLDAAVFQLGDRAIEVHHAVNKHGLIALQVPGQQYRRRIRTQAHHRHSGTEGLDREHQLCAQSVCEVPDVDRDVAAWEIDKVELIEHNRQATLARRRFTGYRSGRRLRAECRGEALAS